MSEPASPLHIRDYRLYWLARFFAVFATISMVVLLGYQVYDVARSDYGMARPEAAFQLGLLGFAQFIPLLLLTPLAGIAADRFDRRRVVLLANLADCLIATTLAVLTWQDKLNLPILFTLAAMHGGARVFNGPALSSIAPNIVPARILPKAIAMGSIAWQAGSVSGPFIGGLLYEQMPALPHFLSAVLLLASGTLISFVRPVRAKHEGPPLHPVTQMIEGFRFVKHERFLLGCITLDLFAVLLAGATALLPVYARDILQVGADGLGLMRGAVAFGAAVMAFMLSWRPLERNVGVKMLWAVAAFGGATCVFAISTNFILSLAILALLGAADMISVFVRSSLVQLYTPDNMRGRVSSISGLAISASNELGELQSGIAAAILGTVGAVLFGGVGAIVITATWAWIFPELRHARTFAVKYEEETPERESTT